MSCHGRGRELKQLVSLLGVLGHADTSVVKDAELVYALGVAHLHRG